MINTRSRLRVFFFFSFFSHKFIFSPSSFFCLFIFCTTQPSHSCALKLNQQTFTEHLVNMEGRDGQDLVPGQRSIFKCNVIQTSSHFKELKNNNNENMVKMLREQRGRTILSKEQSQRHRNNLSKEATPIELHLEIREEFFQADKGHFKQFIRSQHILRTAINNDKNNYFESMAMLP